MSAAADTQIRVHRLSNNDLTNYGDDMTGVIQLSEALKSTSSLLLLEYAAARPSLYCQQPLTPPFDSRS